jgi:hypothetical protein
LNEEEDVDKFHETLKNYLQTLERERKTSLIKTLVKESSVLYDIFATKSDINLFCETQQFELLMKSSPKFHRYLDDKPIPLFQVVEEVVSRCVAAIQNYYSPEGILTVIHELGWK